MTRPTYFCCHKRHAIEHAVVYFDELPRAPIRGLVYVVRLISYPTRALVTAVGRTLYRTYRALVRTRDAAAPIEPPATMLDKKFPNEYCDFPSFANCSLRVIYPLPMTIPTYAGAPCPGGATNSRRPSARPASGCLQSPSCESLLGAAGAGWLPLPGPAAANVSGKVMPR